MDETNERAMEAARKRSRETYYKRKAAGVCVLCGKVPATPGMAHCEACRRELGRRRDKRRDEAIVHGLCVRCRKPYVGKWRMCMACRIKDAEAQKERKLKREERKREKDHD